MSHNGLYLIWSSKDLSRSVELVDVSLHACSCVDFETFIVFYRLKSVFECLNIIYSPFPSLFTHNCRRFDIDSWQWVCPKAICSHHRAAYAPTRALWDDWHVKVTNVEHTRLALNDVQWAGNDIVAPAVSIGLRTHSWFLEEIVPIKLAMRDVYMYVTIRWTTECLIQ